MGLENLKKYSGFGQPGTCTVCDWLVTLISGQSQTALRAQKINKLGDYEKHYQKSALK